MLEKAYTSYGTDPEGFFTKGGKIIGSERVIPQNGLKSRWSIAPSVVRDGIQFELNPKASSNVDILANNIAIAFEMVSRRAKRHGVKFDWSTLVEVERAEIDSLSERSQILGCQPSKNVYGVNPITVDPKTYLKRSAGGHLHFGLPAYLITEPENLITPFDIFVGNTMVMLDRDAGAAERRENYGRAGEYRDPDYGVEYRTLSNFWLRHSSLLSLVFGLADIAISVVNNGIISDGTIEKDLIETANVTRVIAAINANDYELARANFEGFVYPFIKKHVPANFVLNQTNVDKFLKLVDTTRSNTTIFSGDPINHWTALVSKKINFIPFNQLI